MTTNNLETIKNNLENITTIGNNIFNDDLETLTLLMYSYQYVNNQLNHGKWETINLEIYQDLMQQEKILTDRMKYELKTIQINCTTQLWMNEKYGDPLLLGSRRNTELIKYRINQYLSRCKRNNYTGYQIMVYISKLLLGIQNMGGSNVNINELEVQFLTETTLNDSPTKDWKKF